MKAVFYKEYGTPDTLKFGEISEPVIKSGQIKIRIRAASINSWDWDLLTGRPLIYRLLFGVFRPKMNVLGCDIAGEVVEIAEGVSKFEVGDKVFGDVSENEWGGFAEYVCVSEKSVQKIPAGISFEEAAAIPQASVLAIQGVCDKKQIKKGDDVLIIGAGGGVGTFAIQMAKTLGANVSVVDKKMKLEKLRNLGADALIDYQQTDFSKGEKNYDLIIDVVANRSVFTYYRALKKNGVFLMAGGRVGIILQTFILGSIISKLTSKTLGLIIHKPNKNIDTIMEMILSGNVKPMVDKVFLLKDTADAFRYFNKGEFVGKIVVKID